MPSIRQEVWVDVDLDELLEDATVEELAAYMVTKPGWYEACVQAELKAHKEPHEHSLRRDLFAIFEALSLRRPVDALLSRLAWDHFGRSVG